MGSTYPPGFYDEETLKAVEGAFHDIWDKLATSHRDLDGLRVAVIDQLLGLVGQGITDPDSLRTLTLSHFTAQPRI
jgi:hypothetical protein